jgi:hypothetical protein
VEVTLTGYRKNQFEKVAYVFTMSQLSADNASKGDGDQTGVLSAAFNQALETGRIGDVTCTCTVPASLPAATRSFGNSLAL